MEILSQQIILKQPGRYIGWPTVERTRAGELLVVFSGDRDRHICPFGKTQMVRSVDDGRTWTGPATINDCPIDDRDAGIIETARGTLVLSWFTSIAYADQLEKLHAAYGEAIVSRWTEKLKEANDENWFKHLGSWVRRSTDGGRTWGKPIRLMGSAPHGPVQLRDGRLLFVGRTLRGLFTREALLVQQSDDDGCTWEVTGIIPLPDKALMVFLSEPHAVEADDGRLVAMVRCQTKPDIAGSFLHQSDSLDGGRTWSVARPTPIWGFPPHLRRLRDGRLLLSYGHRRPPFGERAVLSRDGGRSWDVERAFAVSAAPNADLGYPSSVELGDGSLFTVYYQCEAEGALPCLMATRWRDGRSGSREDDIA